MNKQEIVDLCRHESISPIKRLGQNFLFNQASIERIIATAGVNAHDHVLEIGPGLGALTGHLAHLAASVTAIEIDSGLAQFLARRFESVPRCTVIHADFLKLSPPPGNFTKLLSNMPYYCASEILFKIAADYGTVTDIYVLIQKEMADRIMAKPGSEGYGAISVTLGLYYAISHLFYVDRHSFYPAPEVRSACIRLERRPQNIPDNERVLFHQIVKSAFWGRRKAIATALRESPHAAFDDHALSRAFGELEISPQARAEQLGVDDYRRLAHFLGDSIFG